MHQLTFTYPRWCQILFLIRNLMQTDLKPRNYTFGTGIFVQDCNERHINAQLLLIDGFNRPF